MRSEFTPSASAAKFGSTRWRSTGRATRRMSSGATVEPPGEQRGGLRAEDQRLARARTGAPAHVLPHEIGRASGESGRVARASAAA